jgi:hypothetical protein
MTKRERREHGRIGGLVGSGGQVTFERHGVEHYRNMGLKGGSRGGSTTLKRYGRKHFSRIAKMVKNRSRPGNSPPMTNELCKVCHENKLMVTNRTGICRTCWRTGRNPELQRFLRGK